MMGPLLAGTLGVALWGAALGQETQREIIVTAPRTSDEVLTAKVAAALQADAYIFADHVSVTAESGVVHIRGRVSDLSDLFAILRLARRIAGKGRVVNEIEFVPIDFDGD
jgi:osmotically-inducible protein OsmY